MPPKRLTENPPPADSSSEEDETESEEGESEEEEEVVVGSAGQNGVAVQKQEEADEDDEEEEEEDEQKSAPSPEKPTETADLDSESTQPSPSLSAFTIKLHKPSQKPNKAGSKRSAEPEEEEPVKKKKKSKAAAGDEDEEPKKGSAIQRLWSEGDELAVLNGLIRYKSEKGAYPNADMVAFQEFIKDSLNVDVSKNQLSDKIRRLKKKYRTNLERGENGQDLVFPKPHDLKCFELSNKVWGGGNERTGKVQNGGGGSGVTLGLPSLGSGRKQTEVKNVEKKKSGTKRKEEVKTPEKHQSKREDVENSWAKYPLLGESLNTEGLSDGVKVILREQLGMLQKEKLEELEHKWECLKQTEVELFTERIKLVNEQVKLALDSIKS